MRSWALASLGVVCIAAGVCAQTTRNAASLPSTQPAFKSRVVTREELDKIPLESVMDPAPAAGSLVFPDSKIAVLPEAREFRAGEPVPVWLLIKSLAQQPERGFPMDVDLGLPGEKPRISGTARLQLLREKSPTDREVVADLKGDNARYARRLLVPPDGFCVNSGDVRNLTGGKLAAGDYRLVFWAEGFGVLGGRVVSLAGRRQHRVPYPEEPLTEASSAPVHS